MKVALYEFGFNVGEFDTVNEAMQFAYTISAWSKNGRREDTDNWFRPQNENFSLRYVQEE